MRIRWLTVFLDFPAGAFKAGVTFWREVTGSGLSSSRGASGEFATLLPPAGDAYLRVQRVAAGGGGCHLDLHVAGSLAGAAERAQRLGATLRHAEDGLIVADSPGGFTFCLVGWHGESAVPSPVPPAVPPAVPLAVPPAVLSGNAGESRADQLCLDIPRADYDRECFFWSCTDRHGLTAVHAAAGARVLSVFPDWIVLADPTGREYCLTARDPRTGTLGPSAR